ncbi:MAG: winged helix-turn-helix domain-containing protein [Nitrososphaerales archaeon]
MGAELESPEGSEKRETRQFPQINWSKFDLLIKNRLRSRKGRTVRSQDTIQMAILEACRSPSVEHWIMIKARLGYETFWSHTTKLLREGMMNRLVEKGRGRTLYSITENGLALLERLKSNEHS